MSLGFLVHCVVATLASKKKDNNFVVVERSRIVILNKTIDVHPASITDHQTPATSSLRIRADTAVKTTLATDDYLQQVDPIGSTC